MCTEVIDDARVDGRLEPGARDEEKSGFGHGLRGGSCK